MFTMAVQQSVTAIFEQHHMCTHSFDVHRFNDPVLIQVLITEPLQVITTVKWRLQATVKSALNFFMTEHCPKHSMKLQLQCKVYKNLRGKHSDQLLVKTSTMSFMLKVEAIKRLTIMLV